jgi:hypothetical protein
MDYLFIKFLLKKLNSKKTINEVSSYINQTGVSIEKIVTDTLIDRGWKKREAQIKFGELENEFKTKKKKAIQIFSATILLIIVCITLKNNNSKFGGGADYIGDSIKNNVGKGISPVKDSFTLPGNGNDSGRIKIETGQQPKNTDRIGTDNPAGNSPQGFNNKGTKFNNPRGKPNYFNNNGRNNTARPRFKEKDKEVEKIIKEINSDNKHIQETVNRYLEESK